MAGYHFQVDSFVVAVVELAAVAAVQLVVGFVAEPVAVVLAAVEPLAIVAAVEDATLVVLNFVVDEVAIAAVDGATAVVVAVAIVDVVAIASGCLVVADGRRLPVWRSDILEDLRHP